MTVLPLLMINGAMRVQPYYKKVLLVVAVLWTVCAPVFFFLPDGIDGIYERFLGGISLCYVCVMAHMFLQVGHADSD